MENHKKIVKSEFPSKFDESEVSLLVWDTGNKWLFFRDASQFPKKRDLL